MTEYSDERFRFKLVDGIIYLDWLVEYVDYNFINDGIKIRLEIANGKDYPMLSDISKIKGGSKEARERLADIDGETNLTALAVIYNSRVQGIIIYLFNLIYNKSKIPTKYFRNDKVKAIKWLQHFKTNN